MLTCEKLQNGMTQCCTWCYDVWEKLTTYQRVALTWFYSLGATKVVLLFLTIGLLINVSPDKMNYIGSILGDVFVEHCVVIMFVGVAQVVMMLFIKCCYKGEPADGPQIAQTAVVVITLFVFANKFDTTGYDDYVIESRRAPFSLTANDTANCAKLSTESLRNACETSIMYNWCTFRPNRGMSKDSVTNSSNYNSETRGILKLAFASMTVDALFGLAGGPATGGVTVGALAIKFARFTFGVDNQVHTCQQFNAFNTAGTVCVSFGLQESVMLYLPIVFSLFVLTPLAMILVCLSLYTGDRKYIDMLKSPIFIAIVLVGGKFFPSIIATCSFFVTPHIHGVCEALSYPLYPLIDFTPQLMADFMNGASIGPGATLFKLGPELFGPKRTFDKFPMIGNVPEDKEFGFLGFTRVVLDKDQDYISTAFVILFVWCLYSCVVSIACKLSPKCADKWEKEEMEKKEKEEKEEMEKKEKEANTADLADSEKGIVTPPKSDDDTGYGTMKDADGKP